MLRQVLVCARCGLAGVAALAIATTFAAGVVLAQAQSGEIFGKVTDDTGAVLPAVTVTLTSAALITPQTTTTTESGAYRFPNIPIGTYTVAFELASFSKFVRENVRIGTGFNAEINAQLKVSAVQETVTVSGAAPVVDTRSTPWREIAVSGFFNMRQGYPFNRVLQSPTRRGNLGRANVDIDRWGDVRLDNFYQLDMRVEKQFPIARTRWIAGLDVFNVFNAATVLERQDIQNSPAANFVEEVLAPRVARFSVKLQF